MPRGTSFSLARQGNSSPDDAVDVERRAVRDGEVTVDARADAQGVIVGCPSCGQANRMRYTALNKTIRCGNCRVIGAAVIGSD